MTLRFVDSFDHYATANIGEKYNTTSNSTISAGNGRRGTQCLRLTNTGSGSATKTIDAQATWITGFAYRSSSFLLNLGAPIFKYVDNATTQVDLRLNVDGTLQVTRNGTALTNGLSSLSLQQNIYAYIEFKVTISTSIAANSCKVRVNGADWITVAAGQSTRNTANTSANVIVLGQGSANNSVAYDYDDLYICDGNGTTNNDFLGDVAVQCLYPTSAGNYSQWTPDSGGTNYSRVDEALADGDTSFVETGTVGNLDSYIYQSFSGSPTSIFGVAWNAESKKTDASSFHLRRLFRASSTDFVGTTDFSAPSAYAIQQEILETNPATTVAWTGSDLTSSEWGMKLNAIT